MKGNPIAEPSISWTGMEEIYLFAEIFWVINYWLLGPSPFGQKPAPLVRILAASKKKRPPLSMAAVQKLKL